MKYPKMIIFDYGRTLLCEPEFDLKRATADLFKYVTKNPNGYTIEDVCSFSDEIYNEYISDIRQSGYDIGKQTIDKLIYERLGISFSLTPLEMETTFWNGTSSGAVMPNADKIINYINQNGIRSAVISNLIYSGDALAERFNRLLPNNKFEFIMTSSDYLFRKPNKLMFETALKKAGLDASDVWYCGNDVICDVEAASKVGIYPVWYDNDTGNIDDDKIKPNCEHLHIHKWDELIGILDSYKLTFSTRASQASREVAKP